MGVRDISIKQHLLTPLSELYGELAPEQEAHYLEALKSATDTELKETFVYLRDNYDYAKYPKIPDILKAKKACSSHRSAGASAPRAAGMKQPWDLRQERHDEAVKAYVESFKQSYLFSIASAAGYASQLEDYVRNVASVQMNLIIARTEKHNWGYNGVTIFGISAANNPDQKHREAEFWRNCKEQAALERIEVTVPQYRVEDWKREVAWRRRDEERLRQERAQNLKAWEQPDPSLQRKQIAAPVKQAMQKIASTASMTPEVAFYVPLPNDSNALPALPVHKPVKNVHESAENVQIPPVF